MAAAATLVIRHIGELATCDPALGLAPGVIRDAALAAVHGTLVYVGVDGGLEAAVTIDDSTVIVDAGGCAAAPGFVDAHTHLVWLGDRALEYAQRAAGDSYEQIATAGGGIRSTVRATAAASLDELTDAARPRAQRMLLGGTTTLEIKSGYGLTLDAELRQLEAARRLAGDLDTPDIVTTYLPLHAAPDGDRQQFIDDVIHDGLRAIAGRARFVDAFCETGAYSVEECRRLLTAAASHGLRPKLHAEQRSRSGGAALAAETGAVSADHLEHATDADLRGLAAGGVTGVILPGAALTLGGPPPPGRRLLDAGARVAIATDCNPGTCYSESMPLMMSLAVATAGMTPAEALVAATSGGAAALGLTDRGQLRCGARCDVVLLDATGWLELSYHLGAAPVRMVISNGAVVAS